MKQCKRVQSGHLLPDIAAASIHQNFAIPWRTNPNTANQISKLKASPLFLMDSLRLDWRHVGNGTLGWFRGLDSVLAVYWPARSKLRVGPSGLDESLAHCAPRVEGNA
ncbi:hypothetical protein F8388_011855 [Cannabis sativa]|uniref:Uncharacterized protein n=1 Tax=Cannabis sativa TaxID=3483 RepID=A0A7J6GDB8_CANSA|nr:hypothetical protein F8388_011855 [Cannabis sativa]